MRRLPATLLLLVLASTLLASCADDTATSPGPDLPTATAASGPQRIDADTAVDLLAAREATVVDVRTPEEHADGHVEGTLLLDIQAPDFDARLDELDRDGAYVVYCRTGSRSADAVERMAEAGFTEVYDAGGYDDLVTAGADTA